MRHFYSGVAFWIREKRYSVAFIRGISVFYLGITLIGGGGGWGARFLCFIKFSAGSARKEAEPNRTEPNHFCRTCRAEPNRTEPSGTSLVHTPTPPWHAETPACTRTHARACGAPAGHSVFYSHWEKLKLEVKTLYLADFCAGAVLITFGVLLGKVSPFQLLTIAIIEVSPSRV